MLRMERLSVIIETLSLVSGINFGFVDCATRILISKCGDSTLSSLLVWGRYIDQ